MDLPTDFSESLASFNANGVEYVLVGVILLGRPPVRVDLLASIDGVSWEQASAQAGAPPPARA
ncbi:hypothetical protein FJ250_03515 [bacterium]|nr:hypothetical protein [bacterium]